jgi:hypothetical protein
MTNESPIGGAEGFLTIQQGEEGNVDLLVHEINWLDSLEPS